MDLIFILKTAIISLCFSLNPESPGLLDACYEKQVPDGI